MEGLPLLALEALCQYLSVADLTACSAVSRRWRALFNEDSLWRTHYPCEPELEEWLRTTPPTVRQDSSVKKFDVDEQLEWLLDDTSTESSPSPETEVTDLEESTNLEPLCQWRQAHIRQNRFINNWKHVRFSRNKLTLDCKANSCNHYAKFITDDVISVECSRSAEITLWNVKNHPPVKCEGPNFPDKYWQTKTDIIACKKRVHKYCVAEHFYVVAFEETPGASEIHIWDLQSGEHIKKEPLRSNEYLYTFKVAGEDVLVVTVYYGPHRNGGLILRGYRYYIYNVKLLAFLPFTAERALMCTEEPNSDLFGMKENYLIIQSVLKDYGANYFFQIFNYKTNVLLHEGPCLAHVHQDGDLRELADGFIYIGFNYDPLVLFDPRDETILIYSDWEVNRDVIEKIWEKAKDVKTMFFLFKHLFSNVSEETITDLLDVVSEFDMNPSCIVGVLEKHNSNVLSIIRFW